MKKMKKMSLIVSVMMILAMLVGCAPKFDAANYLKAVLDNSYKNDSTGLVEQEIGTKEEAEKIYDEGIETELNSLLMGANVSDEVKGKFETFLKDLFKAADYTVTGAEKQGDGFVVNVEYKQLKIFGSAYEAFQAKVAELDASSYETQDELYDATFTLLVDCLNESLSNPQYGDTETTTVSLTNTNNVYAPLSSDLMKLEKALFDIDAMQ